LCCEPVRGSTDSSVFGLSAIEYATALRCWEDA
jgi:hypothetical protein